MNVTCNIFFDFEDIDGAIDRLLSDHTRKSKLTEKITKITDERVRVTIDNKTEEIKNLINTSAHTLFKTLTQAQYDALEPKEKTNSNVIYFIREK